MTLTTAQAFSEFLADSVTPTDAQKLDVTNKRGSTEGYLRTSFPESSDLPLKRVILIGSADRGTLIQPVQDVDVMAEFRNKDDIFETYRSDSGAFLQRVRKALDAKTTIKKIGARGQAVRLFYVSGAHVDIACVFKWNGSGYALPSGTGGWITTDPETQAIWLAQRRQTVGSELTSAIKLCKSWNQVHSKRLESFHLEVMVASMFATVGGNHRDALSKFFEMAPNWLGVSDPAGHSGLLNDYLTWDSTVALNNRFSEAHRRSVTAINSEAAGNHSEAKRLWGIELGPNFPTD